MNIAVRNTNLKLSYKQAHRLKYIFPAVGPKEAMPFTSEGRVDWLSEPVAMARASLELLIFVCPFFIGFYNQVKRYNITQTVTLE